jgi:hypothetical protein
MLALLGSLLGFLPALSNLAGKIADAKIASIQASTDTEKIKADERVRSLEAQRDVLIANKGQRAILWIQAGFALPFVIYNAKCVLWDKVFALGSTDPLSAELFQIEMICLGFYFVSSTALIALKRR